MESIPKKSGIYQIRTLVNGKIYVGSSVNLRARRNRHFSNLRRNEHPNQHMAFIGNMLTTLRHNFF